MSDIITIWDYILLPIYFIIVIIIAKNIKNRMCTNNLTSKYIISGLIFKVIGGLSLCFIYVYYYGGGDTTWYIKSTKSLAPLLFKDFSTYITVIFGDLSQDNYYSILKNSGNIYYFNDHQTFTVVRLTSLFSNLAINLYLPTTILLSSISYIGIWKLFKLFSYEFPNVTKHIAISILFIPSVIFWGSGILKDTYTLSATAWIIYSFYTVFIYKRKIIQNIILIILMSYILLSIRPFMLYISIVSVILMITKFYMSSIKNLFTKFFVFLFIIIVFWGGGITALIYVGSSSGGQYSSIDGMLEKAAVSQQDLIRDYYGGNSFDIGEFEPTISGVLSKAPLAINAGLFYPYLWKANNPVMLLAGLENLIILLLTIYALSIIFIKIFQKGPKIIFKTIFSHPLLIFSLSYSIPFAFIVGLTTSNYGALVRYKIPLVPFYLLSLFIIIHSLKKKETIEVTEKDFKYITK